MTSDEFNNIPKDSNIAIHDLPKTIEFILYNSNRMVIHRLVHDLFANQMHRSNIKKKLETYILAVNNKDLKKNVETEMLSLKKEVSDNDIDFETDSTEHPLVIKRGDIDKLTIKITGDILHKILNKLYDDKMVDLCWCPNMEEFVWIRKKRKRKEKKNG